MLACLLSSPGTFSCFSAGVWGNIAYTRVCNSSIFCVCLSWLFRGCGRCSVCSYIGESTTGKAGENHEACKRWMCALITVMAIVAFHLLSLKHLIMPSSWWCKFLPRLITHLTSHHYWVCSKAVRHLCMHARTWKYDMQQHTHTSTHKHLHNSRVGGNDRAPCSSDKVRKDQDTVVLSGEMSWSQLAATSLLATTKQTWTGLHWAAAKLH